MEIINLTVDNQHIVSDRQYLVSDTENVYHCVFKFNDEWENYPLRYGVFRLNNGEIKQQLLVNNECQVPNEVVAESGYLIIGTYGVSGEKRYPTVWLGSPIMIQVGARNGTEPLPPTPSEYEQIITELSRLENDKADKVYVDEKIDELGISVDSLNERVTSAEDSISELSNDVEELANDIEELDNNKVDEAPINNKQYARKNGDWVEVESGGGGASDWEELTNKPFERLGATVKNVSGALEVNTTEIAEPDNTLPITSNGVNEIVGNINTLLEMI